MADEPVPGNPAHMRRYQGPQTAEYSMEDLMSALFGSGSNAPTPLMPQQQLAQTAMNAGVQPTQQNMSLAMQAEPPRVPTPSAAPQGSMAPEDMTMPSAPALNAPMQQAPMGTAGIPAGRVQPQTPPVTQVTMPMPPPLEGVPSPNMAMPSQPANPLTTTQQLSPAIWPMLVEAIMSMFGGGNPAQAAPASPTTIQDQFGVRETMPR